MISTVGILRSFITTKVIAPTFFSKYMVVAREMIDEKKRYSMHTVIIMPSPCVTPLPAIQPVKPSVSVCSTISSRACKAAPPARAQTNYRLGILELKRTLRIP